MKICASKRVKRKAEIKAKAQAIIYARYPQWKQNNILAGGDTAQIASVWQWIDAVRDHSNALEAQVDAGQAVDLESGWPA